MKHPRDGQGVPLHGAVRLDDQFTVWAAYEHASGLGPDPFDS